MKGKVVEIDLKNTYSLTIVLGNQIVLLLNKTLI